jgi:hypothetical protein
MEKKITKRENYASLRTIAENLNRTDLVAFIDHEVELLNKRAAHPTLTKTQKENLELVEVVFNALSEINAPVTVSDFLTQSGLEMSNQKASALFKKLVDSERVVKVTEKGKSYFSVAN